MIKPNLTPIQSSYSHLPYPYYFLSLILLFPHLRSSSSRWLLTRLRLDILIFSHIFSLPSIIFTYRRRSNEQHFCSRDIHAYHLLQAAHMDLFRRNSFHPIRDSMCWSYGPEENTHCHGRVHDPLPLPALPTLSSRSWGSRVELELKILNSRTNGLFYGRKEKEEKRKEETKQRISITNRREILVMMITEERRR